MYGGFKGVVFVAKISKSFRLDEKDLELTDLLIDHFKLLYPQEHNRTTVITMGIRKLAMEHLGEKVVKEVLDK